MSDQVESYFHFYDKLLIEEKMYITHKMRKLIKDKDLSYFQLLSAVATEDFLNIITEMKLMNEEYEIKENEKIRDFIKGTLLVDKEYHELRER